MRRQNCRTGAFNASNPAAVSRFSRESPPLELAGADYSIQRILGSQHWELHGKSPFARPQIMHHLPCAVLIVEIIFYL